MKIIAGLCALIATHAVRGHEDHGKQDGETIQEYAKRHMASEHHIDSFDLQSFFQLHDLNSDGVWDREEIEAIYGVHHIYSKKKSKDDVDHEAKAAHIVKVVLERLDDDKNGVITSAEFEAHGLDGLPNFDLLGAEGHHYDVESEFFLHHEEKYHSTPETQTDESYNHPEDLEHFAHHREIELKEAEKEAKFQGITVEEVLEAMHDGGSSEPHAEQDIHADDPSLGMPSKPKITRQTPPEKLDPSIKYADAARERDEQAGWGEGDSGYKTPKTPNERMRRNLPYKYKFRRNWGDF